MLEGEWKLAIGGDWQPARSGALMPVESPVSGEVIAEVPDAGPDDALAALSRAWAVQRDWAASSSWARADVLRSVHTLIEKQADRLAALIHFETGKPMVEAEAEVSYGADFVHWYADLAPQISGRYRVAPRGGSRLITMPQPVGPCLLICPWNLPFALAARKVAPAIAAGCTFVLKPAEQTPLATLAFVELLQQAGLPAGVASVVTTSDPAGAVAPLVADDRVRKLSFTGSTAIGKKLLGLAAAGVKRTSMELGGNAPLIVFADCDLDHAIEQTVVAKLRNAGQSCIAANRIYVEEPIMSVFTEGLVERFAQVRAEPGGDLGPMIDARARDGVEALIGSAVQSGGRALIGGRRGDGSGYFVEPTLLADVSPDAPLVSSEIFGPAAAIVGFTDERDVVGLANGIAGGLAGYVFSQDVDRVLRVADRLDVGMVGINRGVVSHVAAPFGGVKESGLGREGAEEGLLEYQELKYVVIDGDVSSPAMATA